MHHNKRYTYAILLLLCFYSLRSKAQSNKGFVQDEVIKVPNITTDSSVYGLNTVQKQTTISYYDGWGRTTQTVALRSSPAGNDMVQPVVYDKLGRQTISYLPYTASSTSGGYQSTALSDQKAFYNNASQYLIATDTGAYSQQIFENSPLQRLLTAGNIGGGFQPLPGQHYKKMSYRYNASSDGNILIWNPDGTYTTSNYYAVNALSVTDAVDEDNHETLVFTDLAGHTILKRQMLTGTSVDTYYIYNNAGMVSYVIPPNAVTLLAANSYNLGIAPLSNLVLHYVYDNRGRAIQKRAPAKGNMYIIYDPLNRPVLMQDTNMAANHQWNYMRYDAKGRVISQGIYTDNTYTTRSAMQTYVNGLNYNTAWYESRNNVSATGYYTASIFPTAVTGTLTPLAYAYYDDYDLKQTGSPNYTYATQTLPGELGATIVQVKGMPTMTRTTTVGSGTTANTWLLKVVMYDKRGNAIQVQSNNQLYYTAETVTDYKTIVPDFKGMPQISRVSQQTSSSATITVQTMLTYDQMYRLLTVSQQYNGGTAMQTAAYSYNEIGQLINKGLGKTGSSGNPANITLNSAYSGTNSFIASNSITLTPGFSVPSGSTFTASIATEYLQSVDYRYNIRGQVTSINNSKLTNDGGITNSDNNDVFGMQILYDQSDGNMGNTASYSDNTSGVKWMSKDVNGNSTYERSYKYSYDQANRYIASNYAERTPTGTGGFTNNVGGFDESGITYDVAGNILTLKRNASTQGTNTKVQIDSLIYSYSTINPDQLLSITDGTDANHTGAGFRNLTGSTANYAYDAEGNLTSDPYKGLSIAYDYLDKTDKITFTTASSRWIDYTYDGSGNILRKRQYDNNVQQNVTDYIDGFVYVNNVLSYFPMPEGRVINTTGTLTQEYIITDPQGNARVSFKDNGSGVAVVTQENSYYATGLIMLNSPVGTTSISNKKLFNGGSEWQNDFTNLPDYYQTFFRNYDAATGRFISTDPDPESAESMTTYQYSYNNPILFNDPIGNYGGPSGNGHPGGHPFQREGSGNYGSFGLLPDGPPADIQTEESEFEATVAGISMLQGASDLLGDRNNNLGGYGNSSGAATAFGSISEEYSAQTAYDGDVGVGYSYYFDQGTFFARNLSGTASNTYENLVITGMKPNDVVATTQYVPISEDQAINWMFGEDANQGGFFSSIGNTNTIKEGPEDEFNYINSIGDKYSFSVYNSVSTKNTEKLLNVNTTTRAGLNGVNTTTDWNLNLDILKLKFTSDIGFETQIGTDSWNLSIGSSINKGISISGNGFGGGFEISGRGGLGTGAFLIAPEFFLSTVLQWATK